MSPPKEAAKIGSVVPTKNEDIAANAEPPRRLSLEEIKAEARAFALSTSKSRKRKIVPTQLTSNKRPYGRGFLPPAPPVRVLQTAGVAAALNLVNSVLPVAESRPPALSTTWGGDPTGEFYDDEYAKFVKILSTLDEDPNVLLIDDDEEEEFQLMEEEEEDEDDEEEIMPIESVGPPPAPVEGEKNDRDVPEKHPGEELDDPTNFYRELEEELGWLEEEDIEAAVATLLDYPPQPEENPDPDNEEDADDTKDLDSPEPPLEIPVTPFRTVTRTAVTPEQEEQLRSLLQKHHQLLLQQAVLAIRAANAQQRHRYLPGVETAEWSVLESSDWVEIVDSAAGMLQDLDQNRKDAIRYQMQLESSFSASNGEDFPPKTRRSLFSDFFHRPASGYLERRLTRAQFTKRLLEPTRGKICTVFDISGLSNLNNTFHLLDRSVEGVQKGDQNILEIESNIAACEQVLRHSEAAIDQTLIPGSRDISENFVDATEVFGEGFQPPCNAHQESILRKNRNYFTAGEDNLVFRGVNLYGEKQWLLIADRFLPERSVNIISQRYAKLSYMLFQVYGVKIDKNGNLSPPPRLDSVDDIDEKQLIKLQKVPPPAILNVHRWSMEEDVTLLKAVALMGSMWAEIRARLIPHRDRGHLRKRYQVLERRIKATASRTKKHEKLMISKMRSHVIAPPAPHLAPRTILAAPSTSHPVVSMTNKAAPIRPLASVAKAVSAKLSKAPTRPSNQILQAKKVKASDAKQRAANGSADSHSLPVGSKSAFPPYPYHAPPYPQHPHPYHTSYMYPPPPGYPPYVPYGYYPHYYHQGPGYGDEGSRAGFEQLVTDPSHGWSQMAHVKSMMENETEVASTIVMQLAKSPSKRLLAKTMEDDSLQKVAQSSEGKSPSQKSLNFNEGSGEVKDASSPNSKLKDLPYRTDISPYAKSPQTQIPRLSPPSTFKTSNGVRMFPESPYFYPHAEFSRNSHSLIGYDLNGVFSNGAHDGTIDSPTKVLNTPDNSQLLGGSTHLMDTDLEAVSALNLLKSPSKLPQEFKMREPSDQVSIEKKSLFAKVVSNINEKDKLGPKGKKKEK